MIITSVEFTDDLVYRTPKADLIVLVWKKLHNMGLSQEEIVAFTSNSAIPLSLAAAVALGNVITEYQARFLVTSLKMLNQWSQQKAPITRIQVPGVLVARDQNGTGRLRIVDAA